MKILKIIVAFILFISFFSNSYADDFWSNFFGGNTAKIQYCDKDSNGNDTC
jgi:hypothetical protein